MLGSHRGGPEHPLLCVSWLRWYNQGIDVFHVFWLQAIAEQGFLEVVLPP